MNSAPATLVFPVSPATIIDVRSEGEFAAGHIPGAVSLPLFDNDQRAQVGTLYKREGSESATLRGLEFAGAKMRSLVELAAELSPERKTVVHCWRGGQRSRAMAWLLDFAGFSVTRIEGGYKAYHALVHNVLESDQIPLMVLGGRTGSGKTELLSELGLAGEQVIDLEGMANHKGSAFGWIGEQAQPTTEQFENNLATKLAQLDWRRRIWLENESRGIGRVFMPKRFFKLLQNCPLANVIVDDDQRVDRLVRMYAHCPRELEESFRKITRKLGGQHLNTACQAIEQGDFATAARVALTYYDKTYGYGLENASASAVENLDARSLSTQDTVAKLIECADHIQPVNSQAIDS